MHDLNAARCLASAALLTLSAASPAARQLHLLEMPTGSLEHPSGHVVGDATDVVLGQLSDDRVPDAAVLHRDQVHLVYAADRRNSWVASPGAYSEIERLAATPQDGGPIPPDSVLALGPGGLTELLWDAPTRTLAPHPISGSSTWSANTHLRVYPDPAGWIVATLRSDSPVVERGLLDLEQRTLTLLPRLHVASGTSALRLLDLDGSAGPEYAAAGDYGLQVFASSTALLHDFPEASLSPTLTPVPMANGLDRLAWIRTPPGQYDLLSVLRPGGTLEPAVTLTGGHVDQALAVDLVDNAEPELLVLSDAGPFAVVLPRDTTDAVTFLYDAYHPVYFIDLNSAHTPLLEAEDPLVSPGTGSFGPALEFPVLAARDLDGDGDEDLFAAGHPHAGGRAMIHFGTKVDEERPLGADGTYVRAWLPLYTYRYTSATDEVRLQFVLPEAPPGTEASAATHVQIAIWTRDESTPSGAMMNPSAVHVSQFALTNPVPAPVFLSPLLSAAPLVEQLVLEVHYLELDATTGLPVRSFPAYHLQLTLGDLDMEVTHTFGFDLHDGTGSGGSTQRPPIIPLPIGGGPSTP